MQYKIQYKVRMYAINVHYNACYGEDDTITCSTSCALARWFRRSSETCTTSPEVFGRDRGATRGDHAAYAGSKVEQGDPAVALGVYARVMQVLRLEDDLALLAKDDELGRKLQDAGISAKLRAPKRVAVAKNEIALGQTLEQS